MLKRTKTTISYFILMLGCILGVFCVVATLPPLICYIDVVVVVIATLYVLRVSRCTYCGKYKVVINPFSHEYFHCKNCGRKQS
ncbi:MAG: hypothetical protein QM426_09065 [Euryarchaeota archaeon]|nr:hypothetical protein [Euryarchaeota archaeon]